MKKWIDGLMANPKRVAVPIMTHPGIDYIGKSVREAVTDGEVHAAAIKALADRYPSAASTVIMDLTVEAEAFGVTCGTEDKNEGMGAFLEKRAEKHFQNR